MSSKNKKRISVQSMLAHYNETHDPEYAVKRTKYARECKNLRDQGKLDDEMIDVKEESNDIDEDRSIEDTVELYQHTIQPKPSGEKEGGWDLVDLVLYYHGLPQSSGGKTKLCAPAPHAKCTKEF